MTNPHAAGEPRPGNAVNTSWTHGAPGWYGISMQAVQTICGTEAWLAKDPSDPHSRSYGKTVRYVDSGDLGRRALAT